ncbi:hypothetical protein CGH61_24960, partial [Vibrio parahaemolyticus]|uniref:hypothetical protein n=1 Tax=Vibrio parahaemolyticus TaxID=670 RepID=UPI001168E2EC
CKILKINNKIFTFDIIYLYVERIDIEFEIIYQTYTHRVYRDFLPRKFFEKNDLIGQKITRILVGRGRLW